MNETPYEPRTKLLLLVIAALITALALALCTPAPTKPLPRAPQPFVGVVAEDGELIFSDEFDGTAVDPMWNRPVDHGCTSVSDGVLTLCVRRRNDGSLQLGRVDTQGRFEFTYGSAHARMRFTAPTGAHSAAWLQTTEDYIAGQAEIDYAENFGRDVVWHNVYWREAGQKIGEFSSAKESTTLDVTQWHRYTLSWLPDRYEFKIDGELVATITSGLSDRPKFVVLSMLVSDWERPLLKLDRMSEYAVEVESLRIRANADTH